MAIAIGIAVALLIIYWRGPNAVWGGATLGLLVGLFLALAILDAKAIVWTVSVGAVSGFVLEVCCKLASPSRESQADPSPALSALPGPSEHPRHP